MKRGDAVKAIRACDYLTANDKLVFKELLEGAEFDTLHLSERFTPTRPELARWTSLSESSVKRSVNHLVSHGWLTCETGRGNGRKSRYRLLPGTPDADCTCQKVSPRTLSAVPKGSTVTTFPDGKGSTETPLRVHTEPSKGSQDIANPKVEPDFALREAGKEGIGTPRFCDYHPEAPGLLDPPSGSYRCQRCAPHLWKESA